MNKREFVMRFVISRASYGSVGKSTVESAETMWDMINEAVPEEKHEATFYGKTRSQMNDDEVRRMETWIDKNIPSDITI
jgi:rubrerythrin